MRPEDETTVGSYFVSNYPPYAYWTPEQAGEARAALERPPVSGTPLGLYLHIPFCRKRCLFCYYKVYTDKDSGEIERYLDGVVRELEIYSRLPFLGGRKPKFIYFGGGTPSYISTRQLNRLVDGMKRLLPWDEAEEITFEGEPGTLTEGKLQVIRQIGVTRLSLGVENFSDELLRINGRAHGSREIDRTYALARAAGFPQINIDLISGMIGESPENWRECVRRTIGLSPDFVTIYQMEIPHNTVISHEMRVLGQTVAPVADWKTKRAWVDLAFRELEAAGYTVTSAYTAVKDPARTRFLYRDLLWSGADLIGAGVASFSHVGGAHFQNQHEIEPYLKSVAEGRLPIYRGLATTGEERMLREFILQMKLGRVRGDYFASKFGVDVASRFAEPLAGLSRRGLIESAAGELRLSRAGLLQVDRILHDFFLPQHRMPVHA